MVEWTPYKNIHPKHLDNFLTSRRGQFLLTSLPGGRTRLEGTTWYVHNLWPAAYWQAWSDFISGCWSISRSLPKLPVSRATGDHASAEVPTPHARVRSARLEPH